MFCRCFSVFLCVIFKKGLWFLKPAPSVKRTNALEKKMVLYCWCLFAISWHCYFITYHWFVIMWDLQKDLTFQLFRDEKICCKLDYRFLLRIRARFWGGKKDCESFGPADSGITPREPSPAHNLSWEFKMKIKRKGCYLYHPGRFWQHYPGKLPRESDISERN